MDGGARGWTTTVRIAMKDGRLLERRQEDFPGTPAHPLDPAALREKFLRLTTRLPHARAAVLHQRLEHVEGEQELSWLA